MKKKYILNGKIYDEDEINSFAQKSNISLGDYLKESGAKEHNDTNTYILNGKEYDGNSMADFAKKSDMPYDEYIKEAGAKKKEPTESPSLDGTSVSQTTKIPIVDLGKDLQDGNTPEGNRPASGNPIDDALYYNELKNKKVENAANAELGGEYLQPDKQALDYADKMKEELKGKGIDIEQLHEQIKDVPQQLYNIPGFSKEKLLKLREDNPQKFERTLATGKWQLGIKDALDNTTLPPEAKNEIWHSVLNTQNNSDVGNYAQQRKGVQDLYNIIDQYGGENTDKLKSELATDRAKTYGKAFMTGLDDVAKTDPNSSYLDKDQLLALHYLQDTNPDAAKGYSAALIDPKKIENDLFAKQGLEEKLMRLKQIGAGLQQSYIQEEINDLSKIQKENGSLSPEQEKKASELTLKQEQLNDELVNAKVKYGVPAEYDRDAAVQEILGQKVTGTDWLFNKTGQGVANTVEGVKNMVSTPFMGDEGSKINQLEAAGENMADESLTYLTQKNSALNNFELRLSPSLRQKVDEIKNRKSAENSDYDQLAKENEINDLLKNNPNDWSRVPIKGGKVNISPSSLFYSIGGLAAQLVPFMALETATGGGATATAGRKLLSTFTSALATSFQEEYASAVREGVANPYSHALRVSAINAAALAGAGTAEAVKSMLGTKTAIGELVSKMGNDEIEAMMKQKPSALKTFAKAAGKSFGESTAAGAKITAATTAGNILNQKLSGQDINPESLAKQGLINVLSFSLAGGIGGLSAKYNKVDNLQSDALLKSSKQPELFIEAAHDQLKDGTISPEQFNQIKSNIEKAAEVSKKVQFVGDNGKPLSNKNAAKLLLLKMQEYEVKESVKGDVPEKLKEKADAKLDELKSEMNDVYKNKEEDISSSNTQNNGKVNEAEAQTNGRQELLNENGTASDGVVPFNAPESLVSVQPHMDIPEPVKLNEIKNEEAPQAQEPTIQVNEGGDKGNEHIPADENINTKEADGEAIQPQQEGEGTSIKNAVTGFRREQMGLRDEIPAAEKEFGATWKEATDKIDNGYDPQDLVNELKKKPRPLTDVENALLLHHQNTKEIQLMDANKFINDAAEKGDDESVVEGKVRKARLLDELQDIYDVDKAVGTENARGLASRRMMIDRKYSLTNMIAEKRASANDGKPLSEEQTKQIEELHAKIKETQQAFDEYVERAESEIKELQEKVLSKKVVDKKSAANKLRDLANKLENSTKGKTYSTIVPITPKMVVGAMRLIADGLEKGGEVLDLIKKAIAEIKKDNPDIDEKALSKAINKEVIDSGINTNNVERKQVKDLSGLLFDRKAIKLRAEAQRAKDEFEINKKKDESKKASVGSKVQNAFIKWQRANKLSNPVTMGKLAMAGVTRLTMTPLEDMVGGAITPLLPKALRKGAIGEAGGLNVNETASAYKNGLIQGMKDSYQIMKRGGHGKSDLDTVFGKSGQLPPEAIDFFGQLHSATKAPFKRFAFERSLSKRLRRTVANGEDVSDPMVQENILMGAYKDANRAIFMQDNKITTGWQRMVNYFDSVDPKTGKAPSKLTATALQWLVPFVKVPTNIAAEIGTNVYGVPVGVGKIVYHTFSKGMEGLSADEKDAIVRNLKKGSLGAAALTLGYMNPQVFGGYYQDKEKRKEGDAKAGALKIFGVNIPAWLIESPIFQAMQIGATVRRVKDTMVKGEPKGLSEGIWAGALGLADHVPMLDQPMRIFNAIKDPKERQWYVGELAKSTIDPALLSKISEWTDSGGKRNPETIGEHIEMGIPGLRQNVPEKKTKEKQSNKQRGRVLQH